MNTFDFSFILQMAFPSEADPPSTKFPSDTVMFDTAFELQFHAITRRCDEAFSSIRDIAGTLGIENLPRRKYNEDNSEKAKEENRYLCSLLIQVQNVFERVKQLEEGLLLLREEMVDEEDEEDETDDE